MLLNDFCLYTLVIMIDRTEFPSELAFRASFMCCILSIATRKTITGICATVYFYGQFSLKVQSSSQVG